MISGRFKGISFTVFFFFALLLFVNQAHAIPVQYLFTIEVTSVNGTFSTLDGFEVGDQLTGGFVYDSDAPVIYEDDTSHQIYSGTNFYVYINAEDGNGDNLIIGNGAGGISVIDSTEQDELSFLYIMDWQGDLGGNPISEGSFSFIETSGTLLSTTDLPLYIDLNDFDNTFFYLSNTEEPSNYFELEGTISLSDPILAPEPATILLFGLGGFLGLFYRRMDNMVVKFRSFFVL